MKILVTGFEPFGEDTINPSGEVAKLLTAPEGVELRVEILPVPFISARKRLLELLDQEEPDIVLSLGQSGMNADITPEMVGINLLSTWSMDGTKLCSDDTGYSPDDVKLEEDGPNAYFTNLPIRQMISAMRDAGAPASISFSAGTHTCNQTLYLSLHAAANRYPGMKADFIHLPFLPEQLEAKPKNASLPLYSMELETMRKGVQAALDFLANL